MEVNALGTIFVNNAFYRVRAEGGCIIDTSSMSAYLPPGFIMPKKAYPLRRTNCEAFMKKMMRRVNMFPKKKSRCGIWDQQKLRHLVCQNRCCQVW